MSARQRTSAVKTEPTNGHHVPNGYLTSNGSNGSDGSKIPSSDPSHSQLITHFESLRQVPWQTDNDCILTGYRRRLPTFRACLHSAFAYVHNETVNIHTHFIGAVFFALLIPLHLIHEHFPSFSLSPFSPDPLPIPPTLHDKVALVLNLLCAVSCLSLSSWFHTVQCHSQEVCDLAHRGDYVGIVILTTGTIVPGMYYAFQSDPYLQIFYMTIIIAAGISAAYVVLSPHHRAHRWHRTLVFMGLGLTSVVPIAHILLTKGLDYARQKVSLDFVVLGGASYITGALLYAGRIPEKLSPGTFDYFGASHQIFHVFVLMGAGFQYAALRGMVWGRTMAVGEGHHGIKL